MRNTAFFPVSPYFFADKGIWIFPPDVTSGTDLIPPRQQFFHFHFRPLLQAPAPAAKSLKNSELRLATLCMIITS
jgi:hypothetical protein